MLIDLKNKENSLFKMNLLDLKTDIIFYIIKIT